MKGPGSGAFTLEEYDAILGIMASKGQDISRLPKPQKLAFLPSTELVNERDVEVTLIEPLLSSSWLHRKRLVASTALTDGPG